MHTLIYVQCFDTVSPSCKWHTGRETATDQFHELFMVTLRHHKKDSSLRVFLFWGPLKYRYWDGEMALSVKFTRT